MMVNNLLFELKIPSDDGMGLATFLEMAQPQQKSKEAVLEGITALMALGILFYFFLPGFRSFINMILLALAVIGLIAFMVWSCFKLMKDDPPPAFNAIYSEPRYSEKPLIEEKAGRVRLVSAE
jgi:hypothetical protein